MRKGIRFAVVGGDQRQRELAGLLRADGYETAAFALDGTENGDLAQALEKADVLILPLPAADADGRVYTPLTAAKIEEREILERMRPGQLLLAGRAPACLRELAAAGGIELVDYFEREELAVLNAVATAEGAIQIMMEELPITLWQAKILVVGFGRIGKILAQRLRGLGAQVSVSARKQADKAWIRAMGCEALDTGALDGELPRFDCVVNTVPARVLDGKSLERLRRGCLCLDLASKPGGMDFEAAGKLGLRTVWALALPGQVAPRTSGAILRDTIYNILEERRNGL